METTIPLDAAPPRDPVAELLDALPSITLPTIAELAAREETVKVTITLSKLSVEYFKQEARARRTQYQKMIRCLLDEYVRRQMPNA